MDTMYKKHETMTKQAVAAALTAAREALAAQYATLPAEDWDVANSRSSADAAINLVEMYLGKSFREWSRDAT